MCGMLRVVCVVYVCLCVWYVGCVWCVCVFGVCEECGVYMCGMCGFCVCVCEWLLHIGLFT